MTRSHEKMVGRSEGPAPRRAATEAVARSMARTAAGATTLLAALAGPAAGQSFDGRYKLVPEADCAAPMGAPGFLRIRNGVLEGAGSTCRMANPLPIRGMDAALYDMQCESGGALWQERAMVMRGAGEELVLVWNGHAYAYPACPVPPLRPRPRPGAAE